MGTNVFIGSLSGCIGHPGVSAYAGSKFALEGIFLSPPMSRPLLILAREIGMVEALRLETAPLGIKTLLFEPGRFRTKLLSGKNMKAAASSISEYGEFSKLLLEGLSKEDSAQPGDPVKLVEIILDVVRGEGVAVGREIPFRLPIGNDCCEEVKAKCEETLRVMEEWGPVIRSTDFQE